METDKLREQLKACFQDPDIRERSYYPEFRRRWEEILTRVSGDKEYFDISKPSVFTVKTELAGTDFEFHLDQLKIADWYAQEQLRRRQVVFHPKRLSHSREGLKFHDIVCRYDAGAKESSLDESMRNIAAAAVPALPPEIQIVYGNKWVESRFNSFFNSRLSVNLIETDYVPAFLASPLEVCLYLFLMDYCIIKENRLKVKDEELRAFLHIFRPSPMLKIKKIIP